MRYIFTLFLLAAACSAGSAQKQQITLEDLFVKNTFRTEVVSGIRSTNDGNHYTVLENNDRRIVKYSYKTGKATDTLLDLQKIADTPVKNIVNYQLNSTENRLLIWTASKAIYRHSYTADFYTCDFKNRELKPLSENGGQQLATFSPDGERIAFVRENNLFIYDLRFGSERQITFDGKFNHVINGAPDWVYEEEFAFSRAFEWAPDGSALAYIRFDESAVREVPINLFEGAAPALRKNALYPSVYCYKYPKAGETNSTVSVHVYDLKDRTTQTMETGQEQDIYIPRIRWTKDPKFLSIIRLNRHQNKMEILSANVRTGKSTILYREENKYYIDESNFDRLLFLEDGQHFVLSSEKSGYMHLYLYDMSGKEKRAITAGAYDIADFYGYDETRKLFYYSSHEASPLEKQLYSVNSNGKKSRLTTEKGWNTAAFSRNFNYRIQTVSSADRPPVSTLYDAGNKKIRVLEENREVQNTMQAYGLATHEFIQIPAADGVTLLNASILKPLDFDPQKKYPLLITQYSGPNSQQVKNSWAGVNWLHYLAQEGFVVVTVDPRGTAARGEAFRKCTYMQLGKLESDDVIAAAKWLAGQSYINPQNIAVWGWSFGGFMSSLCLLKGNDVFSTAIAIAPVTHFKYYDSIYTERYMRTPEENEKGYEENAPLNLADRLKGNLLICHGIADDNVHVQHAYELSERLVQANKQFDMAIYTNRDHSIRGGNTRLQLYGKFVNYLKEHLK
ncbi:MAG: S9 family peptidase [Culturomica sp.]|jgi:dipeptidyl-peptidase-4|nr:S9 family peptidase [Culturomica sp.]